MTKSLTKIALATALIATMLTAGQVKNSYAEGASSTVVTSSVPASSFKMKKYKPARGILMSQSQAFGSKCSTPAGSCTIQPQPVGSPCRCGQARGTTWR